MKTEHATIPTPKAAAPIDTVFGPTYISDWLPAMNDIPDEFKQHDGTKWNKVVSDWFFFGIQNICSVAHKGIDKDAALRHIGTCLRSWEPQHEHKEAGCAYLMSLWFKSFKYDKIK